MAAALPKKPDGLTYQSEFITRDAEKELVARIEELSFNEVRMHGVVARRTVIHYGYDYDYSGWKIVPSDPPPQWLEPLLVRCANAARIERESLKQFLIARYPPDATIGWHRDAPMFGTPVIGISLLTWCAMNFRLGPGKEKYVQLLEPRSLYILDRAARTQWQHSIPKMKELRYSITMRTLRKRD